MAYIGKLKLWLDDVLDAITGLSVDGRTITYTKNDGSTGTITTQDTTYSDATTTSSGLMSAQDKAKLDGLSSGNVGVATSSSNGLMSATDKARHDEMSDIIDSYEYEELPSSILTLFAAGAVSDVAGQFNIDENKYTQINDLNAARIDNIALVDFSACKHNNTCYMHLYIEFARFRFYSYQELCIGQLSIHPPMPIYACVENRNDEQCLIAYIDEEGLIWLKSGNINFDNLNSGSSWNPQQPQNTIKFNINLIFPIDSTNNQ